MKRNNGSKNKIDMFDFFSVLIPFLVVSWMFWRNFMLPMLVIIFVCSVVYTTHSFLDFLKKQSDSNHLLRNLLPKKSKNKCFISNMDMMSM